MRYFVLTILFAALCLGVFFSCKKYKDSPPVNDPRLTNPYCNDPTAVNYNWGFPGKPDNTTCFYPTDIFTGTYLFKDSIFKDTLFIRADSFLLTISPDPTALHTKIKVTGFCSTVLSLIADRTYVATLDTNAGDSTTAHIGQIFCRPQDTVTGTFSRDRIADTIIHIALQIYSDTGTSSIIGDAIKK